ncbi:MAG: cysteine desulfurase family protein [Candidatus Parcubacteria bacterium]|nr:cysteine desulfurase family protein [Candidatus Parcubacteria bacterium]
MKKAYLDYAATTPVCFEAYRAMLPYFSARYGNTMSLHQWGKEARVALEQSRKKISELLNVNSAEIFFTSSASESNNWVLKGIISAYLPFGRHIIISAIEHPCIMASVQYLKKLGFEVSIAPVDKVGKLDLEKFEKLIRPDTILVSVMHANNEIGTIQPLEEIGEIISQYNKNQRQNLPQVLFHTDASQTFGKININIKKWKVDLLTASSHKVYGPKGVGLLYIKKDVKIEPFIHGGEQEIGLRASTINVPAIVGFAKAAEMGWKKMKMENVRFNKWRKKIIESVLKIKGSSINGSKDESLPQIINFSFKDIEGESLISLLDFKGIAVSTGSACSSSKLTPSHVLLALGLVSLGRYTKDLEIKYFLNELPKVVNQLRELSPFKTE